MGPRVQWHHPVPKSRGGRETVPVHPICHAMLHKSFSNTELERFGDDTEALRAHPALSGFLRWLADKPPGFHAPTRRRKI
ncbi:HNH endonuclease [Notoacmeibacter ruber]|uniref:HNH endonuclease n=1 Tax=Notoacmeibacter ruber TaxID=2670375 RepID=A0A3L7JEB3_9HYPH|nr:HNH endonuclease [Notoacmeibacter ruber]